jgi:hypothetical protein
MKIKKQNLNFSNFIVAGFLLGASSIAHAQGGRVGGGGHIVDVNGTPELMDLVKGTTCTWQTGDTVVAAHPEVLRILKKVSALDWYFAHEIETEMRSLNFCFTGPLLRITPIDPKSPVATTVMLGKKYKQLAVRADSTVFVDEDLYNSPKFSENRRAMLLIHETMHTFIPMELADDIRYLYLWTIVKDIALIDAGRITTADQLHQEMQNNQVYFPTQVERLNQYESVVLFITGTAAEQKAAILASASPESLVELPSEENQYLAPWDRDYIESRGLIGVLTDALIETMKSSTETEFESLFKKSYPKLNVGLVALSVLDQLSATKKDFLLQSTVMSTALKSIEQNLMALAVSEGAYRPMASPELANFLGCDPSEVNYAPVSHLTGEITPNADFDALVQIVVISIQQKNWSPLQTQIGNSDDFYGALGLKTQKQAVAAMHPAVSRDRQYAIDNLSDASQALVKKFLDEVKIRVSIADFHQFQKMIQNTRFGNED